MIPPPKIHYNSKVMEAYEEVNKEPGVLAALKDVERFMERKRSLSDSEQGLKESIGVTLTSRGLLKTESVEVNEALCGKRKGPIVAEAEEVDPEMDSEYVMNAAQALFELFGGAGTSSLRELPESKSCEAVASSATACGVKWAAKKSRSCRSKKALDCACKPSSSSTTSATVTDILEVLDSSTSRNHHVLQPVAVNCEDESEADADANSTDVSPCCRDLDRGQKLISQSSVESTLLNSRAESPSSPLRVLKPDAALIPTLDEELTLQFGFQYQAPGTKPSMLQTPKVEDSDPPMDELKVVKIARKQVQRRKPCASKLKEPPSLLLGDVLALPSASSATLPKECIEENKIQLPVTLNLFEPVKLETPRVKVEGRLLYQAVSSTQTRLRSALNETEKEARRLRRVQANRESARQTIKRKQVLCEELTRKAGELQIEKDNLALSLELQYKELESHRQTNYHLKEQILAQATSAEVPLSTIKACSNMSLSPVPATANAIRRMAILPYWWAFASALSVAAGMQPKHQATFSLSTAHMPSEASCQSKLDAAIAEKPSKPVSNHPYSSLVKAGTSNQLSQMKARIPAGFPNNPSSRVQHHVTIKQVASPSVRSVSGTHVTGDGTTTASTTSSLDQGCHSGRTQQQQLSSKPGNLRFYPSIGNGVQGFLGPRSGSFQSEAAALATEARRRRRELKRTKSLQSHAHQGKKIASVKSL